MCPEEFNLLHVLSVSFIIEMARGVISLYSLSFFLIIEMAKEVAFRYRFI
jgi:hypothetical protein